jgi:hypothetical protein
MSNTIGLIAGIALLSFPQISSIPATISSGSASLSIRFQEKSAEPSPQNRAAFNDEKQIRILVKQFVQAESENDADTLEKITSDDWVIMNPKGPGPSKLEVITNIRKDAPAKSWRSPTNRRRSTVKTTTATDKFCKPTPVTGTFEAHCRP